MKIYFAQIMDNLAYYEHEKKIADLLESQGHEVYFPWRDEGVIFEQQSTEADSLKTLCIFSLTQYAIGEPGILEKLLCCAV